MPLSEPRREVLAADYRQANQVINLINKYSLSGVVSLFSSECTAPRAQNTALYNKLFANTDIQSMLVAGFYYAHAPTQETIGEAGGIISYQTIAPIESDPSPFFQETRLVTPCPSTLFGEDVIEVWRLLKRQA